MVNAAEQFSLWKPYFTKRDYKTIYNEFSVRFRENNVFLEDNLFLGNRCLQLLAENCREARLNDPIVSKDLFKLVELCVKVLSQSWNKAKNFVHYLYYICRCFLGQKLINYAVIIGEYAMQYTDQYQQEKPTEKSKTDISVPFLGLFLKALYEMKFPDDETNIFRGWNFVLSPSGSQMKASSISNIVDYFCSLISKLKEDEFEKNSNEFHPLMEKLSSRISEIVNFEEVFMKVLSSIISRVSDFTNDRDQNFFLELLQTFQKKNPCVAVNLCENIYRLNCNGFLKKESLKLIKESKQQLEYLVNEKSNNLDRAVYFCSIVFMKKQDFFLQTSVSRVNKVEPLFEIVLLISEELRKSDLGKQFRAKEEDLVWKKLNIICSLVCIVFTGVYNSDDFHRVSTEHIFKLVLKAEEIIFNSYANLNSVSKDRTIYLIQRIVGSVVNVCRTYMYSKSFSWCREIASKALIHFSSLPREDFHNPTLKFYWEKLVLSLTNTYRELKLFDDCLETSISWAIMLPSSTNFFLDLFCTSKNRLITIDSEMSCLKITCLDLVQSEDRYWKRISSEQVNLVELCAKELEAYSRHDIGLVEPIQKLLNFITKSEIPNTDKMKSYCIASCIFSNCAETLEEALQLLPKIKDFILEVENILKTRNTSISSKERSKSIALLGNLYYSKFRIKLMNSRVKNEADVKLMEAAAPATAVGSDLDKLGEEAYDFVTPGYTFSSQRKLLDLLDFALKNWQRAISKDKDAICEIPLTSVKETALIYKLYCDDWKETESWELLYIIARHESDPDSVVYAFSNLMNTSWEIDIKWMEEVKIQFLNKVNQKMKLNYQLDYLSRCLRNGLSSEDEVLLMEISFDDINDTVTFAKYYFLLAKLNIVCEAEKCENYYGFCIPAFQSIVGEIRAGQWHNFCENLEIQCLFFDVGYFVASRLVEEYNLPLSKIYLKETLTAIQRLGLPLRTCQFLNLSARLDTLTSNLDECNMKLTNVYRILDEKMKTDVFHQFIVMQSETKMVSDIRSAPVSNDFDFEGIPQIKRDPKFQMPEYASHESKCCCRICKNPEYLKLFCEVTFVVALYFKAMNKMEFSEDYFKGVYQILRLNKKLFGATEMAVVVSIQYVDYLAAKGEFGRAETLNGILRKCCRNLRNNRLTCDLNEQMLHLVAKHVLKPKLKIIRKQKKTVKYDSTTTKNYLPLKTPAKGYAVVSHDDLKSESTPMPDVTPLPRRSRRALTFDEAAAKNVTTRKKKIMKKDFNTPPDIVLDLPSAVIEKRMQTLNIEEKEPEEDFVSETVKKCHRSRKIFVSPSVLSETNNTRGAKKKADEEGKAETIVKPLRRRKIFDVFSEDSVTDIENKQIKSVVNDAKGKSNKSVSGRHLRSKKILEDSNSPNGKQSSVRRPQDLIKNQESTTECQFRNLFATGFASKETGTGDSQVENNKNSRTCSRIPRKN